MSLLIINYSDATAALNSFYENIYTALEAQGHLEFVDFSPKETSLINRDVIRDWDIRKVQITPSKTQIIYK